MLAGILISIVVVAGLGSLAARAGGRLDGQARADLAIVKDIIAAFGKQNIDHQLDDISSSVVVASLSVFRKFANQIFKNIPHLHIVDGARIKVKFRKCCNDREQPVVFVHLVDFFSEV